MKLLHDHLLQETKQSNSATTVEDDHKSTHSTGKETLPDVTPDKVKNDDEEDAGAAIEVNVVQEQSRFQPEILPLRVLSKSKRTQPPKTLISKNENLPPPARGSSRRKLFKPQKHIASAPHAIAKEVPFPVYLNKPPFLISEDGRPKVTCSLFVG